MTAIVRALDARLVAPGPRRTFVAVRVALAAVLATRLALRRWADAAHQPDALFEPAFAVAWLPSAPPGWLLVAVQGVGLAAAALAIVGRWPRPAVAVAWLALAFLAGAWSGAGKVQHNDVLLLLAATPFLLARTPAPTAGERDDASVAAGWPPRAALAIVATAYAVAGLQKLRHSGLAWVTSDNLAWVLRGGADGSRSPFPELAAGALGVELSAPVLLATRRGRPAFVVLAAALHTGIWLTLGLDYYGWTLTVAAVALPVAWLGRRSRRADAMGDTCSP